MDVSRGKQRPATHLDHPGAGTFSSKAIHQNNPPREVSIHPGLAVPLNSFSSNGRSCREGWCNTLKPAKRAIPSIPESATTPGNGRRLIHWDKGFQVTARKAANPAACSPSPSFGYGHNNQGLPASAGKTRPPIQRIAIAQPPDLRVVFIAVQHRIRKMVPKVATLGEPFLRKSGFSCTFKLLQATLSRFRLRRK